MALKSDFIVLQDLTVPVGSRLFGGSPIRCWATNVSVGGQQNLNVPFRPLQNQNFQTSDNNNIGSHWNRRKSTVQVTGMENLQINVSGNWELSQVGSTENVFGPGSFVSLSPYKIMRMCMSGHTFYLKGGTAIQELIDGENIDLHQGSSVGSFYSGSGIPVIISNFQFDDTATLNDHVSWTITLIEEKDNDIFFIN